MKNILIWVGAILGGLVGLIVVLVIVMIFIGSSKINKTYDIQIAAVAIPSDAESVALGKHWVDSIGLCTECHGENLGGDILSDDLVFGTIVPSNLTAGRGGVGGTFTDVDFVRAIRHGVGSDGKPLIIMPAQHFNRFSDRDLGAIVAYLKSLPPIDSDLPETSMGPIGRIFSLLESSILPTSIIDHDAPRPAEPVIGVTREYEDYLTEVCTVCHGENFSGGPVPGDEPGPPAPNLTRLTESRWDENTFITAMRTSVTPFATLDEEFMPWDHFANLTDDELKAM